jgi:hypothetical protein
MASAFTENVWSKLITAVADTFRFTADETKSFSSSPTAKLIASIPFIAGCDEAERTAIAHLSVYIAAIRGGRAAFDHGKDDNGEIDARLRLISSFKGGNEKSIAHGKALLSLIMASGYQRDRSKDAASGEYNPLNAGAWDYAAITSKLEAEIKASYNEDIGQILSAENAYRTIWN